jgi:hypothetical protein
MRRSALALLCAGAAGGCYIGNKGLDPPTNLLYFPTALVMSPGHNTLYVVNSDFDLQYNGGTVLAFDATKLRTWKDPTTGAAKGLNGLLANLNDVAHHPTAKDACEAFGLTANPGGPADTTNSVGGQAILHPGPCSPISAGDFIAAHATIGAFASGATLATRNDAIQGARLFLSVRGDPSITWIDVPDDRGGDIKTAYNPCGQGTPLSSCLQCGATDTSDLNHCADSHRAGVDSSKSKRGFMLPTEPVGIAASEDGTAIVAAHQTSSVASLVVNPWDRDETGFGPQLQFFLPNLASGPTDVATVPVPLIARAQWALEKAADDKAGTSRLCPTFSYGPGFLLSFKAAAEVDLLRYNNDCGSSPQREFLTRAYATGIATNGLGEDSRGIAVDPSQRFACEDACAQNDLDCLAACVATPIRVFIANRSPASLLIGEVRTGLVYGQGGTAASTTSAYDTIDIYDQVPLSAGPSHAVMGSVIGTDGALHTRVFVVSFDSHLIFDYDPDLRRVEAVIRAGRGPQALALDTGDDKDGNGPHSYLYVAHFTDSYIGVVDLNQNHPSTFGTMFATIGVPIAPRESK